MLHLPLLLVLPLLLPLCYCNLTHCHCHANAVSPPATAKAAPQIASALHTGRGDACTDHTHSESCVLLASEATACRPMQNTLRCANGWLAWLVLSCYWLASTGCGCKAGGWILMYIPHP